MSSAWHTVVCTDCGYTVNETHTVSEYSGVDDQSHSGVCIHCEEAILLSHNYEPYNSCYEKCSECGYIIQVKEHDYTYRYESMNNVATHYAYCECGDYSSSTHTYEEYNSCYEKCSECGYKNQIAEHDYTYEYLPNPDDTETHFAYCECGKKSFTPQDHSFVPGALADTCEFCGINRDHEHYYTYTPCGDGETHRKFCACGYTQYQQCFGMTMPGQLSRCSMCGQRLNGGLITPLGEEDVALPSNKENEFEEESE